MKQFLPLLASLLAMSPAFAVAAGVHNDFDGDGRADLLWHNADTGANVVWRNGIATSPMRLQGMADRDWQIAGTGDFDGDRHADILWRNPATGAMATWLAGSAASAQPVGITAWDSIDGYFNDPGVELGGICDFDGDGLSDIFLRSRSGETSIGYNVGYFQVLVVYFFETSRVTNLGWKVAGTGDFDGDGNSDILWRNAVTGANIVWKVTDHLSASPSTLTAVNPAWHIAGIGDFNGDGKSDVLWRNPTTGANVSWPSADPALRQVLGTASPAWLAASIADVNGDHRADIVWRNTLNGANVAWLSANRASLLRLTSVTNQAWKIVP